MMTVVYNDKIKLTILKHHQTSNNSVADMQKPVHKHLMIAQT